MLSNKEADETLLYSPLVVCYYSLQIKEFEHERAHLTEMLEGEKEKGELLEQECTVLREGRETLDKKLDQMQRRLHRVSICWRLEDKTILSTIFFQLSTFVGSSWSFVFFIPFEGFSIPDFIHYIYFPILILEKEPVFSLLNVECLTRALLVPFL